MAVLILYLAKCEFVLIFLLLMGYNFAKIHYTLISVYSRNIMYKQNGNNGAVSLNQAEKEPQPTGEQDGIGCQ